MKPNSKDGVSLINNEFFQMKKPTLNVIKFNSIEGRCSIISSYDF